ncbi:hypothetical protein HPB50_006316 [Hyalomma asiaticum]|uniref:Uncharacterized protein n=1 Tax=Hyalomma asiaticum TaxID=266040 RepID=A0ACB7TFQ5_HYAAI|nr:hypothetical protein HPB50_006316 [Hyalomma asiaticum]
MRYSNASLHEKSGSGIGSTSKSSSVATSALSRTTMMIATSVLASLQTASSDSPASTDSQNVSVAVTKLLSTRPDHTSVLSASLATVLLCSSSSRASALCTKPALLKHLLMYAIVLDVELLANTLAEELCAQHGLAYVGLLDYNAYVAGGASQGTEATLFLAFLVEASCLPVLDGPPGGRSGTCYAAALLLQWDLRTGFHRVVSTGSLKEG